jgi:tetratricopeptide (TPR) repeat protein
MVPLRGCKLHDEGLHIFVAGQCSFLQGEDNFAAMKVSEQSDKRLIKAEIAKMFGSDFQASFNRAIDDAVVQVYGQSLLYNGRFQEAVPVFEKELDVKQKRGDDDGSIASPYVQLGRASAKLGGYAEALRYYEEALHRNVRFFGTRHVSVATTVESRTWELSTNGLGILRERNHFIMRLTAFTYVASGQTIRTLGKQLALWSNQAPAVQYRELGANGWGVGRISASGMRVDFQEEGHLENKKNWNFIIKSKFWNRCNAHLP